MALLDGRLVRSGGKQLGGQLPYRSEHAKSGPGSACIDTHQAVAGEGIEQMERAIFGEAATRARPPPPSSHRRRPTSWPACRARRHRAVPRSIRRSRAVCVAVRADRPGRHPTRRGDCRAEPATPPVQQSRARRCHSMASGRPSRRRQISTMASALSAVEAKSYRTAWARSTNSWTAGKEPRSSIDAPSADTGTASGATGYSRSARSRRTVRLVARIWRRGQRASS